MSIARVLLYYVVIALSTIAAAAGQSVCTVHVSVLDKGGRPLDGLDVGDFRATIKGHPIKIVSASVPQQAVRMVIVIDESGSMDSDHPQLRDDGKHAMVRQVVRNIVAKAPAGTQIGLLVFRGKDTASIPLRSAQQMLQGEAFDLITHKRDRQSNTPLWDNLHQCLTTLHHPMPGDVVVVVTDGVTMRARLPPRKSSASFSRVVCDYSLLSCSYPHT